MMMTAATLHAMAVHFPIALLLVAFVCETLALCFKQAAWRRISLWNLAFATWGALASVVTGGIASRPVEYSPQVQDIFRAHVFYGCMVLGGAGLVNAWRLAAEKEMKPGTRWAAWALLGITCAATVYTAHLGGRLVYEFGTATP